VIVTTSPCCDRFAHNTYAHTTVPLLTTVLIAYKVVDPRNKSVAEALSDLLREIGISRTDDTLSVANLTLSSAAGAGEQTSGAIVGTVVAVRGVELVC
jgi:hypothetical protein